MWSFFGYLYYKKIYGILNNIKMEYRTCFIKWNKNIPPWNNKFNNRYVYRFRKNCKLINMKKD